MEKYQLKRNSIVTELMLLLDEWSLQLLNIVFYNCRQDGQQQWKARILYNKMCIIIYFFPISSHKMCEASAEHILWH